jgi:cytochrome c2
MTSATRLTTAALVVSLAMVAGCDDHADARATAMTGGGDPKRGRDAIVRRGCGTCHTIPGVRGADANVGPALHGIADRTYIGGVLQNTPQNMARWLSDPPGVDPMTAMPNLKLTDAEVKDVAAYLYTLR